MRYSKITHPNSFAFALLVELLHNFPGFIALRHWKMHQVKVNIVQLKLFKAPIKSCLNIVVIPKSITKERIIENADVFDFEISKEDMEKLDNFHENLRLCWDPTDAR